MSAEALAATPTDPLVDAHAGLFGEGSGEAGTAYR